MNFIAALLCFVATAANAGTLRIPHFAGISQDGGQTMVHLDLQKLAQEYGWTVSEAADAQFFFNRLRRKEPGGRPLEQYRSAVQSVLWGIRANHWEPSLLGDLGWGEYIAVIDFHDAESARTQIERYRLDPRCRAIVARTELEPEEAGEILVQNKASGGSVLRAYVDAVFTRLHMSLDPSSGSLVWSEALLEPASPDSVCARVLVAATG